ncbi:MAG: iron-sulfur cluster assembly scaffold protein [Dehalococcoidia bacterium]|nr:iron-sulfur cluster assembly scaffold protein [Dehalococcoidia bacterium]HCV00658.1 iron-sulfur cluster assembly scaffold protein [Dehalococcoidia bacterium]|tara:strand:+ start:1019 stop:1393 length:375 start_codon:yes stop_codon:yes gene_type:complete
MSTYSKTVIKHFEHPQNAGEMDTPDGEGTVRNPVCGDQMQVMLRISEGRIKRMQWLTRGCPPAIATSSWTSEQVEGWTLEEAEALTREAIAEGIGGLPKDKVHCSVLAADALKIAITDYRNRKQ